MEPGTGREREREWGVRGSLWEEKKTTILLTINSKPIDNARVCRPMRAGGRRNQIHSASTVFVAFLRACVFCDGRSFECFFLLLFFFFSGADF